MREKFIRFMYGRYGMDSYSKFLVYAGLIVSLISLFANIRLLPFVGWALVVYSYFRVFSKNHPKRYAEYQFYMKYTAGIRSFFYKQKNLMRQRKTHHIYTCSACRQKIRVPKGKGKIEVRCPKCNNTFIKRS